MTLRWFPPRFYWDPLPPTLLSVDVSVTARSIDRFGFVDVYLGLWRLRFRFAVWRSRES